MLVGLVRHAHAEKNVIGTVGGAGSKLTDDGRKQALRLHAELTKELPGALLVSIDRPQCTETARYIAAAEKVIEHAHLVPYGLGAIEGLSESKLRADMPEVAERFEAWNRGDIDIRRLDLPEAQDPHEYYMQGVEFLEGLSTRAESAIIVATRSVLVLLWNVIQGNNPRTTKLYKHEPWENAEYRIVNWQGRT